MITNMLWKKYFTGSRAPCIEKLLTTQKGSHVLKLLKAAIFTIKDKLNWVPINGKQIYIWEENIFGLEPFSRILEMVPVQICFPPKYIFVSHLLAPK